MSQSRQKQRIKILNPQSGTSKIPESVQKAKSGSYNSVLQNRRVIKNIRFLNEPSYQIPIDKQHIQNYVVAKKHVKGQQWVIMMFREAMDLQSDFVFIFEYFPKRQIDIEREIETKLTLSEQINKNLLALVFKRKSQQKILQCSLMIPYIKRDKFIPVATGNLPAQIYFKQDQNFVFGDDQIVISSDGSMLKTNLGRGQFKVSINAQDKTKKNYMTGLFMIKEIRLLKI